MNMTKQYRAGSLTAGILFIGLGIALLLKLFVNFSIIDLFYWGWPFLLILFGAEIIFLSVTKIRQEPSVIRYDVLGVFILILFAVVTLGLYALDETGVTAMAKQVVETHYYDVESPFYTIENLSQIQQVKVVAHQGEVNLETTDHDEMTLFSTWRDVPAQNWEEAQKLMAKTIEVVREGSTLYLFLREPPTPHWFGNPSSGRTTLLVPDHLPLEMVLDMVNLNITVDRLNHDWRIINERGFTHIYTDQPNDLSIIAQGLGHNLINPEAWEEVNEDESRGKLTMGEGTHQLQILTETGEIRLDRREL
jgi:hypothetical protein